MKLAFYKKKTPDNMFMGSIGDSIQNYIFEKHPISHVSDTEIFELPSYSTSSSPPFWVEEG